MKPAVLVLVGAVALIALFVAPEITVPALGVAALVAAGKK